MHHSASLSKMQQYLKFTNTFAAEALHAQAEAMVQCVPDEFWFLVQLKYCVMMIRASYVANKWLYHSRYLMILIIYLMN